MQWENITEAPEGAQIELKGFVYRSPEGAWILSPEPGLMSCCIGAGHKNSSQVMLEGDFSKIRAGTVIQVSGTLHHFQEKHLLKEAVQADHNTFPALSIGMGVVVAALLCFKRVRGLLLP